MALKIYFCDGCNESIPLKDINENRITIDAGKIFCGRCSPKKVTREGPRSSTGVTFALVLLIGLGFGLIAYITAQQIHGLQNDLRAATAETNSLKTDLAAFRANVMPREDAERLRQQVLDDLMLAKRELAGQSDRIKIAEALVHTEVDKLEKSLGEATRNELVALAKQLEKLAEDVRAQSASFEALRGSLAPLQSGLEQLRADFDAFKAQKPAAPVAPAAESGPADAPSREDALKELFAQVKDSEAHRRFTAAVELGRFRTPAVIEALTNLLQDPDSAVRDGAVRSLRRINAAISIPAIIKVLRDEDYFVRSSAREALKSMTSAQVAFDPAGDAAERERGVREWERWWEMNQDRMLRK
jgi:hypothetical protein